MDGPAGITTFGCNWKSMESWLWLKNSVFSSGFNVSILFRNLQKRSLTCRKHGPLQACCLWSSVKRTYSINSLFSYNVYILV